MPLCGWQSPVPFIAKKDESAGQGNQTAKNDDFQYGIVAANPFYRDILEGEDQKSQHEEADALDVGTGIRHFLCHLFDSRLCSSFDDWEN